MITKALKEEVVSNICTSLGYSRFNRKVADILELDVPLQFAKSELYDALMKKATSNYTKVPDFILVDQNLYLRYSSSTPLLLKKYVHPTEDECLIWESYCKGFTSHKIGNKHPNEILVDPIKDLLLHDIFRDPESADIIRMTSPDVHMLRIKTARSSYGMRRFDNDRSYKNGICIPGRTKWVGDNLYSASLPTKCEVCWNDSRFNVDNTIAMRDIFGNYDTIIIESKNHLPRLHRAILRVLGYKCLYLSKDSDEVKNSTLLKVIYESYSHDNREPQIQVKSSHKQVTQTTGSTLYLHKGYPSIKSGNNWYPKLPSMQDKIIDPVTNETLFTMEDLKKWLDKNKKNIGEIEHDLVYAYHADNTSRQNILSAFCELGYAGNKKYYNNPKGFIDRIKLIRVLLPYYDGHIGRLINTYSSLVNIDKYDVPYDPPAAAIFHICTTQLLLNEEEAFKYMKLDRNIKAVREAEDFIFFDFGHIVRR